MQNETFRRLLDSVKLINFIDNYMAENEIGFAEGKKKGHNDAVSVLQDMGLSSEQVAEFKAKLEARNAE